MEKSVVHVGYDPKKLPLDKLSDETVKQGYKYLCEIETILNASKSKLTPGQSSQLAQLSAKFYTYIPHNFGR